MAQPMPLLLQCWSAHNQGGHQRYQMMLIMSTLLLPIFVKWFENLQYQIYALWWFFSSVDNNDYEICNRFYRQLDWRGCYAMPGLLAPWPSCVYHPSYSTLNVKCGYAKYLLETWTPFCALHFSQIGNSSPIPLELDILWVPHFWEISVPRIT